MRIKTFHAWLRDCYDYIEDCAKSANAFAESLTEEFEVIEIREQWIIDKTSFYQISVIYKKR